MAKKRARPKIDDDPAPNTLQRFERALRSALNTPPENPRKKAKAKRKKKSAR